MFGGEASQMQSLESFLSPPPCISSRVRLRMARTLQRPSRATAGLNHTWLLGRYTVIGGVMPYLKTSRIQASDGDKKGTPRTTPVRMPPPVKIPPSTPVPAQTLPAR